MKAIKIAIIATVVLAAAFIAVFAVAARNYYATRYVSSPYYAMVPMDYDMSPINFYDSEGNVMSEGVEYKLTAYSEQGEPREVEFHIFDKDSGWAISGEYVQPGEYILVKASDTLVNGWERVERSKIPGAALAQIDKG